MTKPSAWEVGCYISAVALLVVMILWALDVIAIADTDDLVRTLANEPRSESAP